MSKTMLQCYKLSGGSNLGPGVVVKFRCLGIKAFVVWWVGWHAMVVYGFGLDDMFSVSDVVWLGGVPWIPCSRSSEGSELLWWNPVVSSQTFKHGV